MTVFSMLCQIFGLLPQKCKFLDKTFSFRVCTSKIEVVKNKLIKREKRCERVKKLFLTNKKRFHCNFQDKQKSADSRRG